MGASLTGVGTDSNCLNAEKLETLSTGWKDYLEIDGVEEKDLFLLHYDRKSLESKNVKGIWLNYFLKEWSNFELSSLLSSNFMFASVSVSVVPKRL